jgi:hypothetical protein
MSQKRSVSDSLASAMGGRPAVHADLCALLILVGAGLTPAMHRCPPTIGVERRTAVAVIRHMATSTTGARGHGHWSAQSSRTYVETGRDLG